MKVCEGCGVVLGRNRLVFLVNGIFVCVKCMVYLIKEKGLAETQFIRVKN